MTSKAADTIYNQLLSNDARSIMQGIEASKEVKLIYDGKIYTALLCIERLYTHQSITAPARQAWQRLSPEVEVDYNWTLDQYKVDDTFCLKALFAHISPKNAEFIHQETMRYFMSKRFAQLDTITFAAHNLLITHEKLLTPECLPAIKSIQLTGCQHAPSFVWAFDQLKELRLSNGGLEKIPASIGQLTSLEVLDLSGNKLFKLPETIAQLTKLWYLNVANNKLYKLPESLAQLPKLASLILSHNKIERLPENLGLLPQLSLVEVGFNALLTLPQGFVRKQITLKGWANPYVKLPPLIVHKLVEDFKLSHHQSDASSQKIANTYALFLYVFGQQQAHMDLPLSREKKLALSIPSTYTIFEKLVLFDYEVRDLPSTHFDYFFLKTILLGIHVTGLVLQEDFQQLKELFPDFSFSISNIPKEKFAQLKEQVDLLRYLEQLPYNDVKLLENWSHPRQITSIDLSNQQLEEVPEWLLRYTELKQLNLSHNRLTGLPRWLEEFDKLEELKLNANQLPALPPITIASLTQLDLSYNQLETLPKQWTGLPHLVWLNVGYNQLKHLPEAMLELIHLERVVISHNFISHLPIDFIHNGWVTVKELVSNYGDISVELVEGYAQELPTMIQVSPQEFTSLFCLAHFSSIAEVRQATQQHLQTLLEPSQSFCVEGWGYQPAPHYISLLHFLHASKAVLGQQLAWEGIDIWMARLDLQKHKRVLLAQQQLTYLPNFTLKHWQNPWVDLSGNELEALPDTLEHILNLSRLDVSQNLLQQFTPQDVVNISQVKNLNLSDNYITQLPAALFADCTRLVQLNLSHNELQSLPCINVNESRVKQLDLSFNLFTHVSAELVKLNHLQQIDLSYNRLGGMKDGQALPLEISHLDKVTHLNLSYNFLTILPTGVGLMEKLQWLDLSHNEFAELPKGLCDSLTLETIDLSHNQLVYLPVELAEITSLQQLILTGNPLPMYELRKIRSLLPKVNVEFEPVAPFEPRPDPELNQSPEAKTLCQTAYSFYTQGKMGQAMAYYQKAAALGDAWACYKLAQLLFAQKAARQRVVYWLLRASRQGLVAAQKTLGEYYDKMGDLAKARYWYGKAAAQGNQEAAQKLKEITNM